MTIIALAFLAAAPFAPHQDPLALDAADESVTLVGSVALPQTEEVFMLRLRSGGIHWGAIVDHDPDAFRFSLLAHGGLAELKWTMLDPSQELELREQFGYIDVATEELLVDVETLILVDGTEVSGVILSRDGEDFLLKVGGSLQVVPKSRVVRTLRGQRLPALDVYSREELYTMHAAKAADDDPEDQYELARLCEQILDFDHAIEHYEAVLDLDPATDRPEVGFALDRAKLKAEQQAQIDYLRQIDILRRRKRFDEALVLADAFADTFEGSPLNSDALKMRDRVLVARDDAIRELVRRQWSDQTRKIARATAKKLGYQATVAYCDEAFSEDVLNMVTGTVKDQVSDVIEPEEVLAYWATRKKVRFQNATYGVGTWLLGEEQAVAGTDDKSGKEQVKGNERDSERQALEKKIEAFLKNQSQARRRRSQDEESDEHEAFWDSMTLDQKAQWIRAYYVEFSGDYELRDHPTMHNCPGCAGRGVREVIFSGVASSSGQKQGGRSGGSGKKKSGGPQLVACGICRGIGVQRRVYYR